MTDNDNFLTINFPLHEVAFVVDSERDGGSPRNNYLMHATALEALSCGSREYLREDNCQLCVLFESHNFTLKSWGELYSPVVIDPHFESKLCGLHKII